MLPVGLLPDIGHTFAVSDSVTGLLVSLYAVMVATLAVPLTLATSRFARKPLLLATLLGYALSNVLVAAAPVFGVVAAGRTVGGVTHALFFSLIIGYVPRLVARADVGRALALVGGGASAGFVVGVPLSTTLGTAVGWRSSFAVLAVMAVLTFALVSRLLPGVAHEPTARTPDRRGRGATHRGVDVEHVDVPGPVHGVHVHQRGAAGKRCRTGVRRPDPARVRRLRPSRTVVCRTRSRPEPETNRGAHPGDAHRRRWSYSVGRDRLWWLWFSPRRCGMPRSGVCRRSTRRARCAPTRCHPKWPGRGRTRPRTSV